MYSPSASSTYGPLMTAIVFEKCKRTVPRGQKVKCLVGGIVFFSQDLINNRKEFSTVKVYLAAMSGLMESWPTVRLTACKLSFTQTVDGGRVHSTDD